MLPQSQNLTAGKRFSRTIRVAHTNIVRIGVSPATELKYVNSLIIKFATLGIPDYFDIEESALEKLMELNGKFSDLDDMVDTIYGVIEEPVELETETEFSDAMFAKERR